MMTRHAIFSLLVFTALTCFGQRQFAEGNKVNDLVHTRLDLHFDYRKQYVYGKAWITLKPHFYPIDTLQLDAKGMDLKNISLIEKGHSVPLKFSYDNFKITIRLNKVYSRGEVYQVYISYTAKPGQLKVSNDSHGLYFINPTGREKGKPTQIWTAGEPDHGSCWFPTIDDPGQKCTEEISLNVPGKYVTLSNGRLAAQIKHSDGTRTDTWKMDLPHSPYLFMIAIGDFKIVRDSWHGKPLEYYMEPKYSADATAIFGHTSEAITYFSKILGVDFPWNKYAQIRVRDFNGGMENTTATTFNEDGQTSSRELADLPYQSGYVHELFHQWFGDYVTCRNWSNLPLNESFADLGEILWAEYKFGPDVADEHLYLGAQAYLGSQDKLRENLIRFDYADKRELFDVVTYQKGGRILNMLRHYLGNDAFYNGLHLYLTAHAFGYADAQQLRMAMEEVSGLDLNWFFNEWFYGSGHPVLDIAYQWNSTNHTESIYLKQSQEGQIFAVPMAVDIYSGGQITRYKVWIKNRADTLTFHVSQKPDLVNVDAEKALLTIKTDHKTLTEYAYQYDHAPLFLDRLEAIDAAAANQADFVARQIVLKALKDRYYGLRIRAIEALDESQKALIQAAASTLLELAANDTNNLARASAIDKLASLNVPGSDSIFKKSFVTSTSYAVQAAALNGIRQTDPDGAFALAKKYANGAKGNLRDAIITIFCQSGGNAEWPYIYYNFADPSSQLQYRFTGRFADLAGRVPNPVFAQQGIDAIANLVIELEKYDSQQTFINILERVKAGRLKLNDTASADYVDSAIRRIKAAH